MPQPLLVTLGDPNGLGPELVCRLRQEGSLPPSCLLLGPETALAGHAARLGLDVFWKRIEEPEAAFRGGQGVFLYEPAVLGDLVFTPGRETPGGGRAAGESLEAACDLLGRGLGRALVTGPLSKAALNAAGFAFPGHTEFLAERSGVGARGVCMHLCGPRLRVSLATTHPRLRDVPDLVTFERVLLCLRLTCGFTAALGLGELPVAACGLNPHAGEAGLIGRKEIDVVGPAVAAARDEGLNVAGPLPGDTVFYRAAKGEFGAVLAMYHDQGLAPLKTLHFHECVNVTLGLPFVRTSPGHGTGFDLVGRDEADAGGFRAAVELALRLEAGAGRG